MLHNINVSFLKYFFCNISVKKTVSYIVVVFNKCDEMISKISSKHFFFEITSIGYKSYWVVLLCMSLFFLSYYYLFVFCLIHLSLVKLGFCIFPIIVCPIFAYHIVRIIIIIFWLWKIKIKKTIMLWFICKQPILL